jgi:hypothetical protein
MAYFAFGPGGRDAVRRDRHRYYGWLGRAVAVGIADGALPGPDAVSRWPSAYAEVGAQEVLLMPCSPEPAQVDLLAEAVSRWRALHTIA